jgi:hypothetical protein
MKINLKYIKNHCQLLLASVLLLGSCSESAIYVSTSGSDSNSGSRNNPLATIQKAVEISRIGKIKSIIVREGSYYDVSVRLTPSDSDISILGEAGKIVNLYGGKIVKNWSREGNWLVAGMYDLTKSSLDFRILIVNDTLRPRARFPEKGAFFHDSKWPYQWMSAQVGWSKKPTPEELKTMYYFPDDLGNKIDLKNAELTLFHFWDDSYVGLQTIDTIKHAITFTYEATHPAGAFADMEHAEKTRQYIVWNTKEGMKHPGQWYIDRTSEKLYYWPYSYEKVPELKVLVPTRYQVFQFEDGTKNIKIENLKISCAGYPMSNPGYGTANIGGAIEATKTSKILFKNVSVSNVAGWAMKLNGNDITISDCEFSHSGAGGFAYDGNNVRIERCGIHDVGRIYFGSVGIMGGGSNNTISHCELYNIPYAGVNNIGARSVAEYNLIYNFKLEMKDAGAIYCISGDSTIYRYNAVLLPKNNKRDGRSYYFDEMSINCLMENNFAINTLVPIHHNMASGVIIRNNLFIDQGKQTNMLFATSNVRYTGNIFVADTIVFQGPTGIPPKEKKENFIPALAKYYDSNGIIEFNGNKLYCAATYKIFCPWYSPLQREKFDFKDNALITNPEERQVYRIKIPEAFNETGYRGNFSKVFKKMTSD